MKVAITGATGFVGKYTVNHLSKCGYKIVALGRDIKKLDSLFDDSIIKKETDYSESSLSQVLEKTDIIVHLAAKRLQKNLDPTDIRPYIDDNIILTQNLLKTAQKLNIKKFCQASSIGVYSNENTLPFNELECSYPISIYGVTKLTCENLANLFGKRTSLKSTNLRFSSLFGNGEKTGVLFTDYVNLAREKKTLEIWGKGQTAIDFLYIKDAVRSIEKAISPNSPYGTFNIGSGKGDTVKSIAENINRIFDNVDNLELLSDKTEGGYNIYMDISKASSILGWKPEWTMEAALKDMKNSLD